jgi:hypothetical protein
VEDRQRVRTKRQLDALWEVKFRGSAGRRVRCSFSRTDAYRHRMRKQEKVKQRGRDREHKRPHATLMECIKHKRPLVITRGRMKLGRMKL